MSSRISRSSDAARGRASAAVIANKAKGKATTAMAKRNSINTPSPARRAAPAPAGRHYATRRNPGTARSPIFLDGEQTDEEEEPADEDMLYNTRASRSKRAANVRTTAPAVTRASSGNAQASSSASAAPAPSSSRRPTTQKKREERKASVRKASYDLDGSGSELSDVPDEADDSVAQSGASGSPSNGKGKQEADGSSSAEIEDTESDEDMAARLLAAGDGESLLGSAAASVAGDTDEEEERFIIEDAQRREEKRASKRASSVRSSPTAHSQAQREDEGGAHSDRSGSLSPHTLRQLGLGDLFDEADAYGSSSEPSFTDFFDSDSGDDMQNEIEVHLDPRSDDDELTTDNEDSDEESGMSDISELGGNLLSAAPFLPSGSEALAAGAGTQIVAGADAPAQADIPLLVIEDLDGRLIYARAQDGEAVFGSDGEFECVDDSDADDTDDEDQPSGIWQRGQPWSGWQPTAMDNDETDSGETTDELPNEDMPFPRLLVGSVAPHGGRSARRARAMAARHRRLSPGTARGRSPSSSVGPTTGEESGQQMQVKGKSTTSKGAAHDVDFTISTDALLRDPQGTLEAAAKSLGISVEDVAKMVAGIDDRASNPSAVVPAPSLPSVLPVPGEAAASTPRSRPMMGSFMPTSSKSVHRAVIDGSNQAPSPFTHRHGTQKRGLAARKRNQSLSAPSSKRLRRASNDEALLGQQISSATSVASESGTSATDTRAHSPSPPGASAALDDEDDIIMDLDDVMDASLLWRGNVASSPPRDEGDKTPKNASPAFPAQGDVSGKGPATMPAGINMNAMARWHRIPMAAFREGQLSSSSSSHPLGTYLFARARDGARKRHESGPAEHSPFRIRGQSDDVHLSAMPSSNISSDSFIVSPVMWPVRGRGDDQIAAGTRNVITNVSGSSSRRAPAHSEAAEANKARKTMTRRQKRERKARNDIIKAALRESGMDIESVASSARGSPSDERTNRLASPSAGLPRLSITDPSPNGSPSLGKNAGASTQGGGGTRQPGAAAPVDIPTSSTKSDAPSSASSFLSSSPALVALSSSPSAMPAMSQSTMPGAQPSSLPLSTSASSTASLSYQQPPSSVFGMALHSPLFSGLLNPPNLGFRDDLDEREEEGVLTI